MISLITKFIKALGVNSGLVTPDPIPNSVVKQACGKNTAREALWELSTMPDYKAPEAQAFGAFPFYIANCISHVLWM